MPRLRPTALILLALVPWTVALGQDGGAKPPDAAPPILVQRQQGIGDVRVKRAIEAGLAWLREHQSEDGRWDADEFGKRCAGARCSGPGLRSSDAGVTGLVLLAFLGDGRTHVAGDDAARLAKAVTWLVGQQDVNGVVGPRAIAHFTFSHYVATDALAEAYWLTGDVTLREPVTRARDTVLQMRNPDLGWRYGFTDGANDTMATSYAVLALRMCELAGIQRPAGGDAAYAGASAWFGKMLDSANGRIGYQQRGGTGARPTAIKDVDEDADKAPDSFVSEEEPRGSRPPATTAAALLAWMLCDVPRERVAKSLALVNETAPAVAKDGEFDLHYALFGSLVNAQTSGPGTAWRQRAVQTLLSLQRKPEKGNDAGGSWDPDHERFGPVGGRVYATAMAVLALQAPNRLPKLWKPDGK